MARASRSRSRRPGRDPGRRGQRARRRLGGRCRGADAGGHHGHERDELRAGQALVEEEEADHGGDPGVDAVDDRDDPRLEPAEALQLERERQDQPADRDHQRDRERPPVDRVEVRDAERQRQQRGDRQCQREAVEAARPVSHAAGGVGDGDPGTAGQEGEHDAGHRRRPVEPAEGDDAGGGQHGEADVAAPARGDQRHHERPDERERHRDAHRDPVDRLEEQDVEGGERRAVRDDGAPRGGVAGTLEPHSRAIAGRIRAPSPRPERRPRRWARGGRTGRARWPRRAGSEAHAADDHRGSGNRDAVHRHGGHRATSRGIPRALLGDAAAHGPSPGRSAQLRRLRPPFTGPDDGRVLRRGLRLLAARVVRGQHLLGRWR